MSKRIKRALISVYDKTGIVEFAKALVEEFGIEIISTGGTASTLKENGIPVTMVEEVTGFPEMMNGRVKTLHPKIHAGILADRDNPEHMRQLAEQGIEPVDMVVVNLYPFEKTVADPNCTFEQAIEMIDIGGPCMLRAAAKNHKHVLVISGAAQFRYNDVLHFMANPDEVISLEQMRSINALFIFKETAKYDAMVTEWLSRDEGEVVASYRPFFLYGPDVLRYGENPHQFAEHRTPDVFSDCPTQEAEIAYAVDENEGILSYNNYADGHAALELCKELTRGLCSTGFQPVHDSSNGSNLDRLTDEKQTRRSLPHFQTPGKTYFVTFRLKESGTLTNEERSIVFECCRFWDAKKLILHAVVVMPDHVHLLMTPIEQEPGSWASLSEIMHSIKRNSAQRINELRGGSGALWQHESFDRIIRNEKEFLAKLDYMANNPIKEELDAEGAYRWWWEEGMDERSLVCGQEDDITREGNSHRLETGATRDGGSRSVVFIKHTNACGVGVSEDPVEAYRIAYLGDPNAAMGGILACNFDVSADFAKVVMETYGRFGKEAGAGGFFAEVWIAPDFDKAALEVIRTAKKWGERARLLAVGDMNRLPDETEFEYKSITGGMLIQKRDTVGLNEDQWKVVTKRTPTQAEMDDLRLAWLVCKHTKSNAITICKDNMLIGNGAGQMSRVMSCRIATWLAKENGHEAKLAGSVAASDAFFPFPDGPSILMDAGITAIIQPGGSKRDDATIKACDERGVAMIMTGTRHFKH